MRAINLDVTHTRLFMPFARRDANLLKKERETGAEIHLSVNLIRDDEFASSVEKLSHIQLLEIVFASL